jgi:Uma2 family endonuclease
MLMRPSSHLVTADELLHMPDDGFKYELVAGRLIKMPPPGFKHGFYGANIHVPLHLWARATNIGVALMEVGFKLASDPDTVRAPDVAFVSRERLGPRLPDGYWNGAPDLAVEVLSPDDRPGKVRRKIADWLSHGVRRVWVVNPKACTLTVHRPNAAPEVLAEEDTLRDEAVLPGFQMSVREIFAEI